MLFRIILWLSLAWLPLLMFLMHRNETRFKKNIVVEVTLPYQARTDAEVLRILDQFVRQSRWINLLIFLLSIPLIFIEKISLLTSAWMTWVLVAITLPMIPYVRTNLALKRLKISRGWKKTRDQVQHVKLTDLPSIRWISPWIFILAIVLSFLPLLWDIEMFPLYLVFGISTIAFWFGYRHLYRNKSEMIDENTKLTRVLTQVRRRNWGQVWLISAFGFAALSVLISLFRYNTILQVALTIFVMFLMTVLAIRAEFKTRRVQEKLTVDSGKDWYIDDDDHWIGGIVYYNPNAKRLMINARVGINSTFNLARTSGKILAGILMLLLLSMPFTGVILNAFEKQPLSFELTESALIAHRGSNQEMIELSEISDIKLLTELPERMTRKWGTAMDQLLSGLYSIQGIGSAKLSLDPTVPPFLLVSMKGGSLYLVGSRQPGEAEAIFNQLK